MWLAHSTAPKAHLYTVLGPSAVSNEKFSFGKYP